MSSSILKTRDLEATGSGGKILRGRRTEACNASPYLRPKARPRPPPPPPRQSWFSGLVSGAGKLISSVFRLSPSPSPSCMSSSSSDDDGDDNDSDDDDDDVEDEDKDDCSLSKEAGELDQNRMIAVSTKDPAIRMQPATQRSDTKLSIEQCLLQETFSRDECIKLTKIIQSRVVNSPNAKGGEDSTQKGLHDIGIASPGTWRPLSQTRKSGGACPYSAGSLGVSPGVSAVQSHSFDIRETAIIEAKKWFQEKKLEPSFKSEQDNGPHALISTTLPHVTAGDIGSPVDVAKSYMQVQPPWASPALGNVRFNGQPPPGVLIYKDESPCTAASPPLTSTKGLKRNSAATGSWDSMDGTRRVRLKATDDMQEPSEYTQSDSCARTLEHKTVQAPADADKREAVGTTHDSDSLPSAKSVDAYASLQAKLPVDSCQERALHSDDGKCVEVVTLVNFPVTNGVDSTMENLVSDRIISHSETKVMISDEANQSDAGGILDQNAAYASDQEKGSHMEKAVQDESSLQSHRLSGLKETQSTNDPRSLDEGLQMQKAGGLGDGKDTDGSLSRSSRELIEDLGLKSSVEMGDTSHVLSHGLIASDPAERSKLSNELSTEVTTTNETNSIVDRSQNGTDGQEEESLTTKYQPRLTSGRRQARKSTMIKPGRTQHPKSQPDPSPSQVQEPTDFKAAELPKARTKPNSNQGRTGKSSTGAVKQTTRVRRGRGKGKMINHPL